MSDTYDSYLASAHWQTLKQSSIDVFTCGCIITGSKTFNLHHLNYMTKGKERFWADIIPLCQDKHIEFHSYAKDHNLSNHEVLRWIDSVRYQVSSDTRRRLEKALAYNRDLVNILRRQKMKRKQDAKKHAKKQENKHNRKVMSRHIAYHNLKEITIVRNGREIKMLVRKTK